MFLMSVKCRLRFILTIYMKSSDYNLNQPKKPTIHRKMKSFVTFALLGVAACAVDMQAEQSYQKIFSAPSAPAAVFASDESEDHTHDDGTVHVNVWETIDAELMELMNEVTALMASVTAQGSTLMETQMNF